MTENFKISEVDEIFDVHSVKISIKRQKAFISHTNTRKFELFVNFLCFVHGQVGTVLLQWELFFPPVPTRLFLFLL